MISDYASIYELHARECDEADFWGQVRRTVNGKPVPEDQIRMIFDQMCDALDLRQDDNLLDICCGNGALSARFFMRSAGGLGVDYSRTLVNIAQKHFKEGTGADYVVDDAVRFLREEPEPERFHKALLYGSLSYFSRNDAEKMFANLREHFPNVARFVVGNVPDMAHLHDFFGDRYEPGIEERPDSALGVWWTRDALSLMAERTGWVAEFRRMPEEFYASHYRFDAVLVPR